MNAAATLLLAGMAAFIMLDKHQWRQQRWCGGSNGPWRSLVQRLCSYLINKETDRGGRCSVMEQLCSSGCRSIWISASAKSPTISLCCAEVALWLSVLIHFLVDLHPLGLLSSSSSSLANAHHNFWQWQRWQLLLNCRRNRCGEPGSVHFLCRQRLKTAFRNTRVAEKR